MRRDATSCSACRTKMYICKDMPGSLYHVKQQDAIDYWPAVALLGTMTSAHFQYIDQLGILFEYHEIELWNAWFDWQESTHTCLLNGDVPIIGNNQLINRRSCWLWWLFLIFNNRSLDACTKHAITRFICTTRPQGNEVSDTDSLLDD